MSIRVKNTFEGLGLRALVETICKDKNAIGSNLEKRIDDLVRLNILTQDADEILHSLRIMGNTAAHEVMPLDQQDALVALEIVEHLLRGVYILPSIASKLPQRKPPTNS